MIIVVLSIQIRFPSNQVICIISETHSECINVQIWQESDTHIGCAGVIRKCKKYSHETLGRLFVFVV